MRTLFFTYLNTKEITRVTDHRSPISTTRLFDACWCRANPKGRKKEAPSILP